MEGTIYRQASKLEVGDKIVVSDEDSKWIETVTVAPEWSGSTVIVWTDKRRLTIQAGANVAVRREFL